MLYQVIFVEYLIDIFLYMVLGAITGYLVIKIAGYD